MVEINTRDCSDLRVVKCWSTENPSVVADIRSNPVEGKIARIGKNSLFPSLQCYISISDPVVLENQRRVNGHILSPVTKLIPVVQKLSLLDVRGFDVGETSMADKGFFLGGTDRQSCAEEEQSNGK